jgi:hypothetical protein
MFGSLLGVVTDVVKIAAAPVSIALDVTRVVTKPVADVAQDAADAVHEEVEDLIE